MNNTINVVPSEKPETLFNKGIAYLTSGDYASAEKCFRRALALTPESLETQLNLGYVLDFQGCSEEALRIYEAVLEVAPENAKARYNLAGHLLRAGDLLNGFADYESRFAVIPDIDNRTYDQPLWNGEPLNGRSILVYCEQGLGDALMFSRYLPLLSAMGARVSLEAQQPLVSLLSGVKGLERAVLKAVIPLSTDFRVPLLSLPHIFQTTLDSIPDNANCLTTSDTLFSLWKERLGNYTETMRIGLAWAGKLNPDPDRSCPPEQLERLFSLPDCRFFSLQIGENERFKTPTFFSQKIVDLTDMIRDFSDTAALILNLDLVITIDTAVAHLAGILGKPVWVMLPHVSDWRWLLNRNTSPWYPNMQLFRQPRRGDWSSVVEDIALKLESTLQERTTMADFNQQNDIIRFQSALCCLSEGKYTDAVEQLLVLRGQIPDDPAILYNLGRAYQMSGQWKMAADCYQQAINEGPGDAAILYRLGELYLGQKAFSTAETYLRKALALMPQSMDILLALGGTLVQIGDTVEAFDCCYKMLAIDPNSVEAKYNLAFLQLRSGDYLTGFTNFEARLDNRKLNIDSRTYSQPRWDGSPLGDKSILVFGEQGMGDVVQFARYLPLVAERGGKVILEVDPPLIPLFVSFPGVSRVLAKSAIPPLSDVYIHLLSLPHIFGTTIDTVPNRTPYIHADPVKIASWRDLLADEPAYRIGLVWRGSPNNPIDKERSCPLAAFAPLATLAGVRFFSLQVGAGNDEIPSAGIALVDHTDRLKDLSDTAAYISNLDLVIGVDTVVTHLAGAMGKPTWIALPHIYDWRWIAGRNESPWYPTMHISWQQHHGDWASAVSFIKEALELQLVVKSDDHKVEIETLYNLGCRLKEDGNLEGAEQNFREIVKLNPNLPDSRYSLGVVLHLQGRHQEAVIHYQAAVDLDPYFIKAYYNLANALLSCGRYEEALAATRATLRCDPTHADAHWLLGMLLLQSGDLRNGWREYEWRWKAQNFLIKTPDLDRPQWDGSALEGKTLLIHMEQGRGDMIQFIRYAPMVAAMGGKVIVCAVQELVSLLESVEGVSLVVPQTGPLPDFDLHTPVLSLPHLLNSTLETIPCNVPYLQPHHNKVEFWRKTLPDDGRLRVGLAWQGSPLNRDNQKRSCALAEFQILGDLPGINFFSLQLGKGSEQLSELPESMKITDLSDQINDFSDTAAIIVNLDLVISVCTAVAHLAGALGKPVWTLLSFVSDWRWFLERSDSPWYPTMRLFRQNSHGDWYNVLVRVRQELIQMQPTADFFNRQGIYLIKAGRIAEAECAFSVAITRNPDNAEAHCNRGVALDALQRYEEAIDCYRIALSLRPDYVESFFNMGNSCLSLGNPDGACACYERVLQLMPNFVPVYLCLGEIAKSRQDYNLAHEYYQKALSIDSCCPDALQGSAETYQAEEKFERAINAYKQVLVCAPDRAETWNKLGTVYHSQEKHTNAEECYRRALKLFPDRVAVLNNLGVTLLDQGRLDEAIAVYRNLLEIDDNYADGHWNLSVALLSAGEYLDGWQEYEWRFRKSNPVKMRSFAQPCWDGAFLDGKTILLHAEQGFGDTIQFVRYVPLVTQRGGSVIIECQVLALKRLLLSLDGVAQVIVAGDPLPPFDCHLPIMSLPLVFGTTVETIPSPIPYLAAETNDIDSWKRRLGPTANFRVGLVWFAKQSQVLNRKRSCPLQMFAPLWTVPGTEFYSLQIGTGAEQLESINRDHGIIDLTRHIKDFADTAALMTQLDLVITIDTATAHLAGALGVQTWAVLPHVAEWRWLCRRQDSPWYPGIRLFRQPSIGNWPVLMASVAEALFDSVNGPRNIDHSQSAPLRHIVVKQASAGPVRSGIRVGLAWSGRQDNPINRKRSCPFSALSPLLDMPGVTFVNLQLDAPEAADARIVNPTGQIQNFEDTAALMANLDLIISIDTSVANLAAASGRPTWVLLSHVSDWRWQTGLRGSLWYPGVQLFRQPDHGDWDSVIREVADCLVQFSGSNLEQHKTETAIHTLAGHSPESQFLQQQLGEHLLAARLKPSCPDAQLNVGASLALLGRNHEAAASFNRVLELSPDHIAGHLNLAYSLLALGEFTEGWRHFEWRLQRLAIGTLPPWPMLQPGQIGTDPGVTSLMVHCEQGYGDSIMFSRFLPLLADAGYRVVLSCQPPLADLLTSISGIDKVVPHGEMLPKCDFQVLLLSLPHLLSTTPDTLPAKIPYLSAGEQLKKSWQAKLDKYCQQAYFSPAFS